MKIGIFPNLKKNNVKECTENVYEYFNKLNYQIYLHEKYFSNFKHLTNIIFGKFDEFSTCCKFIVVVGGDGTIIKCAHNLYYANVPILAINSGRLGFMASIEASDLHLLDYIKDNNYSFVDRMMIEGKLVRDNQIKAEIFALNDIVITKKHDCKIIDFSVSVHGTVVSALRADGVIFSTPTGSTAYSLSAGGPIIEPSVECIEFTQICPFSLSARSMLFSSEKEIFVEIHSKHSPCAWISADGFDGIEFFPGDKLIISKSNYSTKFIDIDNSSFYNSVNNKLMQPIKIK